MGKADTGSTTRNNKTICLPFLQEVYNDNIRNAAGFRKCIDEYIASNNELFPPEITGGYRMKDSYYSKKQSIMIRTVYPTLKVLLQKGIFIVTGQTKSP